ncbi:hypothetical protein D031_2310A, partial [Vibrio parahaemolyticus VP-48]
MPATEFN